jgi:hypothetical protein
VTGPAYPSLYQVNIRTWLTELGRVLGRPATLDDVPDGELDRLAGTGFDWIWLLSVWQTGLASQRVSRSLAALRREFEETLPDLVEEDIGGSGFAIAGYEVHSSLGGDEALARLRERLRTRGQRLMLDFVPNHTALDHPWVENHPDYYVRGTGLDQTSEPRNYAWIRRAGGDVLLAHGRDPFFPGCTDTLQLDYGNAEVRAAMTGILEKIAGQCDGVRCDMAMLMLPDVFARTWGIPIQPFWPSAIRQVRERFPGFLFMAEVYWDREWTMQQQGFDYAYDKRLYDRLREGHARPVREHLQAGLDYQNRLARFLENHDEPRAATAFPPDMHRAAAVICYLSPGLRFFHQGQFEGRRKRISPHLVRCPEELADEGLGKFYGQLLSLLRRQVLREGDWRLLDCRPAWEGNLSSDGFLAFAWEGAERLLVVVNYAPTDGQCYASLPFRDLAGRRWLLRDLLGEQCYEREGDDLQSRGLYLDLGPWQYHVFELRPFGSEP